MYKNIYNMYGNQMKEYEEMFHVWNNITLCYIVYLLLHVLLNLIEANQNIFKDKLNGCS